MKGERGPRSAKYLMVFEIDTVRSTRSLLSGGGHASQEENDRFDEQHPETAAAWERLSGRTHHAAGFDDCGRPERPGR